MVQFLTYTEIQSYSFTETTPQNPVQRLKHQLKRVLLTSFVHCLKGKHRRADTAP